MVLDLGAPDQLAGIRIERVNVRAAVDEIHGITFAAVVERMRADRRRAAKPGLREELPMRAARLCIERIDCTGLRADEQSAADHRRLAARLLLARQAVGPLELEARHVVDRQASLLGRLEARVRGGRSPAVPGGYETGRKPRRGLAVAFADVERGFRIDLGRADSAPERERGEGGQHRERELTLVLVHRSVPLSLGRTEVRHYLRRNLAKSYHAVPDAMCTRRRLSGGPKSAWGVETVASSRLPPKLDERRASGAHRLIRERKADGNGGGVGISYDLPLRPLQRAGAHLT